jgi:exonuclease III
VTPALVPAIAAAEILKSVRGWAQGSDHVPVIVRFRDGVE